RFALKRIPGYRGRVGSVELHLLEGSIALRELALSPLSDHASAAVLEADRLQVKVDWKRLLTGALVADVRLENPRASLDIATLIGRPKPQKQNADPGLWQEKARDVLPFRISVAITGGAVQLTNVPGLDGTRIRATDIDLSIENLTNTTA